MQMVERSALSDALVAGGTGASSSASSPMTIDLSGATLGAGQGSSISIKITNGATASASA
ncbi:hypothetical protein [Candidatus Burkholderia verschuerenii]|uniref:hypothetical protein n=1 Tax=Candidatus Burkholderia verschuerenii TaxID=242163 RepID=UPI000AD8178E|nr:hypothetical protein [Candidatus Burkholderia verschuerenii]